MDKPKHSSVIYGDAPFIEDMGVLTTLCLLYDEVLLFGSKSLDEHFNDRPVKTTARGDGATSTASKETTRLLLREGAVTFLSPSEVSIRFPGSDQVELPGIQSIQTLEVDGKTSVMLKIDMQELSDLSRLVLLGLKNERRIVSSMIRDASLIAAASSSGLPIVCEHAHIAFSPPTSRVSEVAKFLAQRTLQRLALPELRAYRAEDILEARVSLKEDLHEFKAGVLDLVWLLHQRSDLTGDLEGLSRDCNVLIDTKIAGAVLLLERAISNHANKSIRRMLKAAAGAILEIGKSLIVPTVPGALLGGSGALLKLAENMEKQPPSIQIASFIYKVREHKF